jgi:uncharacterized protein (TIGR02452 family)
MNRAIRAEIAADTVRIVEAGDYEPPNASKVSINDAVQACLEKTRCFEPEQLCGIRDAILRTAPTHSHTAIGVHCETALESIRQLVADATNLPVGVLNFASARNAGGGFLSGADAQEESLARSSALHASLLRATTFYTAHRHSDDLRYSDRMILSPDCPIFRDDDGILLESPRGAHFITSAAPNAAALEESQPQSFASLRTTLERRAELVLALAIYAGCRSIVLGAWGCGVFRNDPKMVAEIFGRLLRPRKPWHGRFARVRFSIVDRSPARTTYEPFASEFAR